MNGPALFGQFVGGFLGIYVFSKLIEWAILKRVLDDPIKGKVGSVLAALALGLVVYTLTSYGRANYTSGIASYVFAAAILSFFAYQRGARLRDEQFDYAERPDLEETFR